jgi:predicted unusual protein kinase regulating ubiquinone biosynthesis (AarF/ABC1/UbiB family)
MRKPSKPKDENLTARLRAALLGQERAVPTSSLGRLWRTGRGLGSALLGRNRELDEDELVGLLTRLGELKGVTMKAGQMLSYVGDGLSPQLRAALSLLQTAAPATPLEQVRQIVAAELGAQAAPLLASLEDAPVAVASIGQVHRARWNGVEVAVKVRHPDVEKALEADFRSAKIGGVMGAMMGAGTVGDVIEEARTAFLEECDFALEGERQRRFAGLFADDPTVVIPQVEWASPRVLITRWQGGLGLEELLATNPDQAERNRLGEALFRFWFRTLYREGLFHGDPHPGNFAFDGDHRVVIYDFGCVREFAPDFCRAFRRMAAATRDDDLEAMGAAFGALGGRIPTNEKSRGDLRTFLRGFFGPLLEPGARRIAGDQGLDARRLLADKRALLGLQPPGKMLFLFRLRFGLYAVLSRLGAEADWGALEASWSSK